MTDHSKNPEQIFHQARQLTDLGERDAFLLGACGKDLALRSKVDALLAADEEAGAFLASRMPSDEAAGGGGKAEAVGDEIGRYKLLQEIGEGGFGVVYLAEQTRPMRRRVALKVIKLGMDTKQVLARFELERQALAMMDHPNIAMVLDGGATESGRPFFVMELVQGIPITTYCDRNNLTVPERLALFGQVCAAVQHAHHKGIVHRDLKPSNVMVTLHDGVPVPKVIDFGIAKATSAELTEKTLFTEFGQVIGTPIYMSPEQAEMSGLDIDTRSDIYSMGVLLYELLTGTTPFTLPELRAAGLAELQRFICEREPLKPSARVSTLKKASAVATARGTEPKRLGQLMRGDLDWIIMKALEKDRTRRYATANALAADLVRFLADEPVLASPPSTLRRAQKFVRRNRKAVAAAAIGLALLLAGSIGTTWGLIHEREAKEEARRHQEEAVEASGLATRRAAELEEAAERLQLLADQLAEQGVRSEQRTYASYLQAARLAQAAGRYAEAKEHHKRCPEPYRDWEWRHLGMTLDQSDAVLEGHEASLTTVAWSSDGSLIASGSDDETLQVRDARTGRVLHLLEGFRTPLNLVRWAPDDQRILIATRGGSLQIWDAHSGELVHDLHTRGPNMYAAAWSPDGSRVISGSGASRMRLWDAATGACIHDTHWPGGETPTDIAWSPDGRRLSGLVGSNLRVWDLVGAVLLRELGSFGEFGVTAQAWTSDGSRLLLGGYDGELCTWVPGSERFQLIRKGEEGRVLALAFSPGGDRFAVGGEDSSLSTWDALDLEGDWIEPEGWDSWGAWHAALDDGSTMPRPLHEFLGHDGALNCLAWGPDGNRLVTGGTDGTLRLWEARALVNQIDFGAWSPFDPWSPDGEQLLSGIGYFESATVNDAVSAEPLVGWDERSLSGSAWVWSEDGDRILAVDAEGLLEVVDAQTGEVIRTAPWGGAPSPVEYVSWSPDERYVALHIERRMPRVVDLTTGEGRELQLAVPRHLTSVAWSRDWAFIAAGDSTGGLEIWDASTEHSLLQFQAHRDAIDSIAWSSDGERLATGSRDHEVRVWDRAAGEGRQVLIGHQASVSALGWGPDGRRLASGDEVGHLRIWDADTGDYLLALETTAWEGGQINSIAWSPDGERLHAATYYESVIWESRLETAQAVWRANGLRRAAELEEERLEAFVRDLFQKHVFLEPVLEALRTDKRLDAEDREAAIALAEWDGGPSAWRLNDLAWDLVDPEREDPATDVAAALEYARAAVDLEPGEPMYLDTLAWALFANGLDAEALEASVLALQHASEEDRGEYGGYLDQLEEALEDRAADPSAGDTNN